MGQDIVSHSTADRISLHAGVPVVDSAENARVGDLRSSGGEAREGSRTLPDGGRNCEWRVVSKSGLGDKGWGTPDRRMARRVVRVSGGFRLEKIDAARRN